MLKLQGLEAGYDESMVIRNIELQVKDRQVVCIMGRNGVGKTTLLKTIMGIISPRKGKVLFMEEDITKKRPSQRAQQGIGYVPQGREIFPKLSVYENLLIGLEAGKEKKVKEEVYAYFPILKEFRKRNGGDLSGGQQQQLAIARALVSNPSFLLLDEPTEGIQPNIVEQIQEVIKDVKHTLHTSMILVEQDLEFVKSVADYVYVIDHGSIVYENSVDQINDDEVYHYLSV
ncbi:urea ABC transporter ATP-binding subunit UrtE [Aquibacillus koreensis]|uniref:Urea ABC transporter ATP-binding subunit UrtE n=1 Tax=Aquibacillus koreensis TaxID=279446 RepID=A0A9X3WM26_9BACI|nr:urea ABC transporter ATP-binding subunit UrtE [Aquibacillus koreensis]MCT2534170.1 urea ABC transporter ATP-binding subunit UrtE [Aquibacillus koreensis]MDC3422562.1 urea ABC transporter ATP-binding subunit UrtE [Aquibacillus koreensis]